MWEEKDKFGNLRYEFSKTKPKDIDDFISQPISDTIDNDWREELYINALIEQRNGTTNSDYNQELIAEWRKLYDPCHAGSSNTVDGLEINYEEDGWASFVKYDPAQMDYWLDFIDTDTELMKYSVKCIGRRTKIINSQKARSIYNSNVEDIMFLPGAWAENDEYNTLEQISECNKSGQSYTLLNEDDYNRLSISSTPASCFDEIRDSIYQFFTYNTTVSLVTFPKYYLEPNTLIQIIDKKSGLGGDFIITQFTLPLTYNGTMTISAAEALVRI